MTFKALLATRSHWQANAGAFADLGTAGIIGDFSKKITHLREDTAEKRTS